MIYNIAGIFNFLISQCPNFTIKLENLKMEHIYKILMLYNNTGISNCQMDQFSNFSNGKILEFFDEILMMLTKALRFSQNMCNF